MGAPHVIEYADVPRALSAEPLCAVKDDFYTYTNKRWLRDIPESLDDTQKYMSSIDNFKLNQHVVYGQVMRIIKDTLAPRNAGLAAVYASMTHLSPAAARRHVHAFIAQYDQLVQAGNMWHFLGRMNRVEMVRWSCPLHWEVYPDEKNSSIMTSHVYPPSVTLYNTRLYKHRNGNSNSNSNGNSNGNGNGADVDVVDANFKAYRETVTRRFIEYVQTLFDTCLAGTAYEGRLKASDVYDVECEIISAGDTYDPIDRHVGKTEVGRYGYIRIPKTKAIAMTGVDWDQFSQSIGYDTPPRFFVTSQVGYLKKITECLCTEWTSDKWRSYWFYIFLRQIAVFHDEWQSIHYDFHDKFLRGKEEQFPRTFFPIFGLTYAFNNTISREYTRQYNNPDMIANTNRLIKDIMEVYTHRVKTNAWMSKTTKHNALMKLKHLTFCIGTPGVYCRNNAQTPGPHSRQLTDPCLAYDPKDAWGNMMRMSEWRTNWMANRLDMHDLARVEDTGRVDWKQLSLSGAQSYIVNAFYLPSSNNIYVPTAYFQRPLCETADRGYEYALSHIGYTLAHEIAHALHADSDIFNWRGELEMWWSPKDYKKYQRRLHEINYHYSVFAKRDGVIIEDPYLSLPENVADITGLSVCEECLTNYHNRNNMADAIRRLSYEYFYTYFSIQNHQHVNPRDSMIQLLTNPHLSLKYRTNVPLSRMRIFRELYGIKETDGMWWHDVTEIW